MVVILPLGVFLALTAIVMLTYYGVAGESATQARLREMQPRAAAPEARVVQTQPQGSLLRDAVVYLGQMVTRGEDRGLSRQLIVAGLRSPNATPLFLGIRTIVSVVPAAIIVLPKFLSGAAMGKTGWYGMMAFVLGHFGANYWLKQKVANRIRVITESLPDVLDIMVVCLEAGLGLNAAIQRVGEERNDQGDILGKELNQVHAELRAGRDREEALHDLGIRNGSEDLKSLTALMIQSQRLGASMGQTLRAHADLLRTKRRQRAEEASRKLPIKMLFPLGCFLLPPLFITVIGPAILSFGETVQMLGSR